MEYFLGLHSLKWMRNEDLNAVVYFLNSHKDIKVSLHICETEEEVIYFTHKYGVSPIQVLNELGLLTENTLLVHCNYLNNEDIKIIQQSKASVAVCHCSNLKLVNATCDISMLLKHGINVMVATDGPATSDSLSLLDAIKVTALMSNIDLQSLYDMITINPAKYMKIPTGSIQVGNMADILFYDKNSLNITYRNSILENLVYLPNNKPCYVMKEGIFIINNYKFNSNIEEFILKEKNRIIKLIEDKVNVLNC